MKHNWQTSWCHKGFRCLAYRQLSANFMAVTTILFTHTTFLWATCCLVCFITIVKPFLTLMFTTVHIVYLIWKKGSWWVLSIDRGCLLLHDTWYHLWYIQRSMYAHSLICISYRTYEIDHCSLFLSFHGNAGCDGCVRWWFRFTCNSICLTIYLSTHSLGQSRGPTSHSISPYCSVCHEGSYLCCIAYSCVPLQRVYVRYVLVLPLHPCLGSRTELWMTEAVACNCILRETLMYYCMLVFIVMWDF
jgi:hypothetical protein